MDIQQLKLTAHVMPDESVRHSAQFDVGPYFDVRGSTAEEWGKEVIWLKFEATWRPQMGKRGQLWYRSTTAWAKFLRGGWHVWDRELNNLADFTPMTHPITYPTDPRKFAVVLREVARILEAWDLLAKTMYPEAQRMALEENDPWDAVEDWLKAD